jgi:hypothetical protein
MKTNKLVLDVLSAPFPSRFGRPLAPQLALIAGLPLLAVGLQATADPAVVLPDDGLPVEFRCLDDSCPLGDDGTIGLDNPDKYLQFTALELDECFYPPDLTNNGNGIGVLGCNEESSQIDSGNDAYQEVLIEVLEFVGEPGDHCDTPGYTGGHGCAGGYGYGYASSSTLIEGIYLNRLSSFSVDGCLAGDLGEVFVTFADETSDLIHYTSDTSDDDGVCATPGEHAIFVDFGELKEVASIRVTPLIGGLYAAGLEVPDVSPENCTGNGEDNNNCEIQVGDPGLDGGDLRAIISDPDLTGNVDTVAGPYRVRDDRAHCQPGASDLLVPTPLIFDDATVFTYLEDDVVKTMMLPLIVSDNAGTDDFFTISEKGCGTPRMTIDGPPVPRSDSGWTPYLDIVAIGTDIEPVASVLGFESDGLDGSPYECDDVPGGDDASLLTQPLLELNTRDDEAKILSGVPGIIDPVGRDITTGCGSKRGSFKGFSYVAWNLIHATQTDIRSETGAEIFVLGQSSARFAACVSPSYYYGQLAPMSSYIATYFNYAAMLADMGFPTYAEYYLDIAIYFVEQFKANLDLPGATVNFENCFATGPKLDMIKDSSVDPVLPGDKPLNAWGDLISQLDHLSYVLQTFKDELIAPPPP